MECDRGNVLCSANCMGVCQDGFSLVCEENKKGGAVGKQAPPNKKINISITQSGGMYNV